LYRLVLDADVAGESGGHDVDALRQVGHRLAIGGTARAVDGLDRGRFQSELLGCLGDVCAAAAFVLDLVVQILHLGAGAFQRDLALDCRSDALE
jgi:hypothetical protein